MTQIQSCWLQGLKELFKPLGVVVKVKMIGHGNSCGEPAAKVVMQAFDAATAAVDQWGFRSGNANGLTVRYKHPKDAAREKLKEIAQSMLGGDYADYDDPD